MIKILLIILAAVFVLLSLTAAYLFRVAAVRKGEKWERQLRGEWMNYLDRIEAGQEWFRSREKERIYIKSYDGLKLAADFLPAEGESKRTIILFHGYRSKDYFDFSCAYEYYHSMGLNIISVFQRSHGPSEGKYICFGVRERYDCLAWCRYAAERFGTDSDIFLSGLSMGASTVMMASSLELPENVRGIISDCGFISPGEEFRHLMRKMGMPQWPMLNMVGFLTKHVAGFGIDECSAEKEVAKGKTPMLFIHGEADDFVPAYMSRRCYEACAAEKELVTVPGAGHGVSFLIDSKRCAQALENFFERYSKCAR